MPFWSVEIYHPVTIQCRSLRGNYIDEFDGVCILGIPFYNSCTRWSLNMCFIVVYSTDRVESRFLYVLRESRRALHESRSVRFTEAKRFDVNFGCFCKVIYRQLFTDKSPSSWSGSAVLSSMHWIERSKPFRHQGKCSMEGCLSYAPINVMPEGGGGGGTG